MIPLRSLLSEIVSSGSREREEARGGLRAGPLGSPLSVPPPHSCPRRSTWLRPCCGKRAAVWQVFLLSASLNSVLVACVILVVILLTLELLIDIKLLQCE